MVGIILEVIEKYGKAFFDKPILQSLRRLRNCTSDVLDLDTKRDNRLNNVRGYWKYGMNVWGKELRAAKG